ncbi:MULTISPECIES: hypothetical protein [Arthrospira]|nr:hypothetical protein [Arthrospira platensis]MDF2213443.1 hypothetical protein [Arthrospira platensis NCB002]MDT9185792.1 hypothetical protein [Limnospira sp. PMC 289.06]MDT9298039.1 hypothetical protein [Arthrospira platensis PCC 7345]MDT9313439.1 hypothetical protein [Limnospira sp. Paracas R14]WAK73718.1 hypothetical protein AP9108_35150 [Arthrospira sp. PCC 9108]
MTKQPNSALINLELSSQKIPPSLHDKPWLNLTNLPDKSSDRPRQ